MLVNATTSNGAMVNGTKVRALKGTRQGERHSINRDRDSGTENGLRQPWGGGSKEGGGKGNFVLDGEDWGDTSVCGCVRKGHFPLELPFPGPWRGDLLEEEEEREARGGRVQSAVLPPIQAHMHIVCLYRFCI